MTVKAKMTREQLKRSHDAMARFLVAMCRWQEISLGSCKAPTATADYYRQARRLIRQAGFKYEPKK